MPGGLGSLLEQAMWQVLVLVRSSKKGRAACCAKSPRNRLMGQVGHVYRRIPCSSPKRRASPAHAFEQAFSREEGEIEQKPAESWIWKRPEGARGGIFQSALPLPLEISRFSTGIAGEKFAQWGVPDRFTMQKNQGYFKESFSGNFLIDLFALLIVLMLSSVKFYNI
jgi:hypothetical protein